MSNVGTRVHRSRRVPVPYPLAGSQPQVIGQSLCTELYFRRPDGLPITWVAFGRYSTDRVPIMKMYVDYLSIFNTTGAPVVPSDNLVVEQYGLFMRLVARSFGWPEEDLEMPSWA